MSADQRAVSCALPGFPSFSQAQWFRFPILINWKSDEIGAMSAGAAGQMAGPIGTERQLWQRLVAWLRGRPQKLSRVTDPTSVKRWNNRLTFRSAYHPAAAANQ